MNSLAYIFLVSLVVLSVFQLLLILGKPYGEYAWGGQHKVLPRGLRIGSAISIGIYVFMALVTVERARLANTFLSEHFAKQAMWSICVYLALGIVMNGASRSKKERMVWTPTVAVLTLVTFLIARS